MKKALRTTFLVLVGTILIFTAGFSMGTISYKKNKAPQKEASLRHLMETQGTKPEEIDAIISFSQLGTEISRKDEVRNFWLTLLPSVLIAVDILIHLLLPARKPDAS